MLDNLIQKSFLLQAIVEEQPENSFSCICDDAFTLLHISSDLLSELGFTRRDIQETFNNSFLELLYAPCREQFLRLVSQHTFPGMVTDTELCLLRKSGDPIWRCIHCRRVIAADGTVLISCCVEDLLVGREDLSRPSVNKVGLSSEKQLILEWDIAHQHLYFPEEWRIVFGYEPPAGTASAEDSALVNVHEDDRAALLHMIRQLRSGAARGSELEVRVLRCRSGAYSYAWCKLVAIVQTGADETPVLGTIFVTDISDEKARMQTLENKACRDGLTNLLNKEETHRQIEHQLSTCNASCSALFIIDVDNFKQINDIFGHHIGDCILSEMSKCLVQQFRVADTLGRVGGDEFMVFMSDIPSSALAEAKASALLLALNRLPELFDIDFSFSCSIGIALSPQHAQTFQHLYEAADLALCQAKRIGKNRFCIYGSDQVGEPSPLCPQRDVSAAPSSPDDACAYVPHRPFSSDSDTTERSICSMLSIVAMQLGVSRAYIFQTDADGDHFSTAFEWRSPGAPSFWRNDQSLCYSALGLDRGEALRRNRVLVCSDICTLSDPLRTSMVEQGVQAILLCFILDSDGNPLGGIGFSDCTRTREWTTAQIDAVTFLTDSVSTFLCSHDHFPGNSANKTQEREQA